MTESNVQRTGQCLCGAVKVKANSASNVTACHCEMCRKWCGGPLLAITCGTDVSFQGEEQIGVYRSSDWAERGFCKACGTNLFYRLVKEQEYHMPSSLFDQHQDFLLTTQLFVDTKPGYYDFANQTKNLTQAELFAMYAPPAE